MGPLPHGPHAAYVLAAYAVSAIGLGAMIVETLWRTARWRAAERRQLAARQARRGGEAGTNTGSDGRDLGDAGEARLVPPGDPRPA